MLDYEERKRLLLERGVIESVNEVFTPNTEDGQEEYSDLSNFYQTYLEEQFDFETPVFFFGAEETLNAWAWKVNGLDVICINHKALHFFKSIITEYSNDISEYLSEKNINTQYDNSLPAHIIMCQFLEMFLFYHETTHLIQEQEPVLYSLFIDELVGEEEFNIVDHVCEYDADLIASFRLASHVFQVYLRQCGLESEAERKKFLEDSCIIAIAAYIIYRLLMFPDYGDFYTKRNTHPHVIFRVLILAIHLTEAVIENVPFVLDRNRVIVESMDFIDDISELIINSNASSLFFEMGRENFISIIGYMHELNQLVVNSPGTAYSKTRQNETT